MERTFETTLVEFDDETGIGRVTLNRPDSLNAINSQMRDDIVASLRSLEATNEGGDGVGLRVVILEGAEENFCAGADINEFGESPTHARSGPSYREFVMDFPIPIIAKIRGYCLGGGLETAMACDIRFAHVDAQFGLPEVDLGLIPGSGVVFISELCNPSVAKEIAFTGEPFSANRAHELDIVNRVYDETLEEATEAFAADVASKPPLAIQAIKESANIASETGLRAGWTYEKRLGASLRDTEDFERGRRAFAEEQYEPEFTGR